MEFTPIRRNAISRKERIALAPQLLDCGARAVTISKVLGLSATDARNIYRDKFVRLQNPNHGTCRPTHGAFTPRCFCRSMMT